MKAAFLPLIALLLAGCSRGSGYEPRNGDIVFQISRSSQSKAIQLATHSPYSHMGIVYIRDGKPLVFEAVQPVKTTPLAEWAGRGERGHFVAKRLRNAESQLSADSLERMRAAGEKFMGKNYDLYFEWSDERIYCSELVWKVYRDALGIELGKRQKLREFNLSDPEVKARMRQRYGRNVPMNEPVISPGAQFDSPLLVTVER
jgi:hypothetical protein